MNTSERNATHIITKIDSTNSNFFHLHLEIEKCGKKMYSIVLIIINNLILLTLSKSIQFWKDIKVDIKKFFSIHIKLILLIFL